MISRGFSSYLNEDQNDQEYDESIYLKEKVLLRSSSQLSTVINLSMKAARNHLVMHSAAILGGSLYFINYLSNSFVGLLGIIFTFHMYRTRGLHLAPKYHLLENVLLELELQHDMEHVLITYGLDRRQALVRIADIHGRSQEGEGLDVNTSSEDQSKFITMVYSFPDPTFPENRISSVFTHNTNTTGMYELTCSSALIRDILMGNQEEVYQIGRAHV